MDILIKWMYYLSPLMAVSMFLMAVKLRSITWHHRRSERGFSDWIIINSEFIKVVSAWVIFAGCLTQIVVDVLQKNDALEHYLNVGGIAVLIFLLQVVRLYFEDKEKEGFGKAPLIYGIHNLIRNVILLSICYVSTMNFDYPFDFCSFKIFPLAWAGRIIAALNVAMIIKYRIYDDVFRYSLYSNKSVRYVSSHPGHTLMRGLLDHILRAYLFSAYSFAILQMSLMNEHKDAYIVAHTSNNRLVDFFYFNIVTMATVGYGDITPVSAFAKLLTIFEIIFSLLVLATVVMLLVARFQKISSTGDQ
ncbi:MAG: ion transporter [Nitrospirae bacterium]|nr:ion transporter [Nitrospirota bacterium]